MALIHPKNAAHVRFSPGAASLTPGSSYAQPFELLAACHERVVRSLDLLTRLIDHTATQGADAQAADAAGDVLRYFDIAAPAHHEDEEQHVFPALDHDAKLRTICQRLRDQHQAMSQAWQALRTGLLALQQGRLSPDLAPQAHAFAALYDEHLRLEDQLIFPAAQAALDEMAQTEMGREMAGRRGVRL